MREKLEQIKNTGISEIEAVRTADGDKGELLEAGKDHLIIKDLQTNMTYMLLTIYLSYVAFDEDIEYEYPFS